MTELTKEIVTSLQEVTKALNTQITQGAISAQRSNAQTKSATDITNKMLSQMISVYKATAPKGGASGPPEQSLLLQNLLELDKRREDKADRRAAEKAAKDEAAAEEKRIADEKEASLDRFSRENIRKTMATLDTSNRDMGMGFAGFRDSFKLENLKKAKETKAFQVKERKTMKLRENNKLKFEIREKRAEAKKERFDKGNPLQKMVKFQKEAKLARITAKNERKTQRAADRKERNTKLYNKMAGILKGVLVFGAAVVILGLLLKSVSGIVTAFNKIKDTIQAAKDFTKGNFDPQATDLEMNNRLSVNPDVVNLEAARKSGNFTEEELKIFKKNQVGTTQQASLNVSEFAKDSVGVGLKTAGFASLVPALAAPLNVASYLTTGKGAFSGFRGAGQNLLNAPTLNSQVQGNAKDNVINDLALSRARGDLVEEFGEDSDEVKKLDELIKGQFKKDQREIQLLKVRADGIELSSEGAGRNRELSTSVRNKFNSMTQEEAQAALDKYTEVDGKGKITGRKGKFQGTRDIEGFLQESLGKGLYDTQAEVMGQLDPEYLKGNSNLTSFASSRYLPDGSDKDLHLLEKIERNTSKSQTGDTTIIDAKNIDNSISGGENGAKEFITQERVEATDSEFEVP